MYQPRNPLARPQKPYSPKNPWFLMDAPCKCNKLYGFTHGFLGGAKGIFFVHPHYGYTKTELGMPVRPPSPPFSLRSSCFYQSTCRDQGGVSLAHNGRLQTTPEWVSSADVKQNKIHPYEQVMDMLDRSVASWTCLSHCRPFKRGGGQATCNRASLVRRACQSSCWRGAKKTAACL